MKANRIAAGIAKLFSSMKIDSFSASGVDAVKLGDVDSAVLRVAMLVSALDGNVTDDELKAFGKLAKKCRGYTAASAKAVFDSGLRSAGYIELLARFADERTLLSAFAEEVFLALPARFHVGSDREIRRAFVMWLAMAMADGDYSPVERKAIGALTKIVSARIDAIVSANAGLVSGYSPMVALAYAGRASRTSGAYCGRAFLMRAEGLLGKLRCGATAESALRELKALVERGE